MNNKYVNRSKISEAKFRELVRLFVMDLTAIQISKITGLNRNTVNRYLKGTRQRITEYCEVTSPLALTSRHQREGNKFTDKLIGLLEHEGGVFTGLLTPSEVKTIADFITENRQREYFVPTVTIKSFEMLIKPDDKQRIYLCDESTYKTDSPKYRRLEGFWGYAQSRLEKFKGLHDTTYLLHLKECEFRFNNGKDDLYNMLLKIIRNKPLF